MPRSVNKVTLLGHLGRDAETKFLPSGTAVTKFSLATTRRVKQGEEWKDATDWHNIVLWKHENLANHLTKGKPVLIMGRIETREWEKDGQKHKGVDIVAEEIVLLGGKDEAEPAPAKRGNPSTEITDDDVPF